MGFALGFRLSLEFEFVFLASCAGSCESSYKGCSPGSRIMSLGSLKISDSLLLPGSLKVSDSLLPGSLATPLPGSPDRASARASSSVAERRWNAGGGISLFSGIDSELEPAYRLSEFVHSTRFRVGLVGTLMSHPL